MRLDVGEKTWRASRIAVGWVAWFHASKLDGTDSARVTPLVYEVGESVHGVVVKVWSRAEAGRAKILVSPHLQSPHEV